MQNYYPTPVRYTVSGGRVEDDQWGASLAGILYVVMGALLLLMPAIKSLGIGAQLFLAVFAIPAFMTTSLSPWVALPAAAILIVVGAGIVTRQGWAYFPGMALAFLLFLPSFPVGSAVGLVLLYVLWQGLPSRRTG